MSKTPDEAPIVRALAHHKVTGNIREFRCTLEGKFFITPNGFDTLGPLTAREAQLVCHGLASAAQRPVSDS